MSQTVREWLEGLPAAAQGALATRFAQELRAAGLTVYKAETDETVPIPPVLSPEILDDARMAALSHDAHLLLAATVKLARRVARDGGELARRLTIGFTPLELAALAPARERLDQVATARVDYFIDAAGAPRALELNATIPAMQGYSDLIAQAWVRLIGEARGLPAAAMAAAQTAIGSNTSDLLRSVLAHYRARGGQAATPSILIVSRRGDAQIGELRHYERVWTAAGHHAMHCFADELEPGSGAQVRARGRDFDLVYRHVFARRVEPTSPLGRLLVEPGEVIIINPVLSSLEVKGMLALLSAGEHAEVAGLDDAERDTIARVVPWTRLLLPGPATLPDGGQVADLPTWAAAHPGELVLKRSWDYGGKSVVLGPEADADAGSRVRMQELTGASTWREFVAAAAVQPELWVVQGFVPPPPRRHLLVEPGEGGEFRAAWRDLYVDVSAYTNLGDAPRPSGGACRASGSRIVNILGGGGLTPLVPASAAAALAR